MEKSMNEQVTIKKDDFLEIGAKVCAKYVAAAIQKSDLRTITKLPFIVDTLAEFAALLTAELFNKEEKETNQECDDNHDCESCEIKELCDILGKNSYEQRLGKEYWDLTEKHNKLTEFIEKIESGQIGKGIPFKGDINLLKAQEHTMYEYLQVLRNRAKNENIDLSKYKPNGGRK